MLQSYFVTFSAFSSAVAGDEGTFLSLLQTKGDLVEEFLFAHGLGNLIDG